MKSTWTTTLGLMTLLFALSHRGLACGGHGDNDKNSREWTTDELAELEAKWGFEVRVATLRDSSVSAFDSQPRTT